MDYYYRGHVLFHIIKNKVFDHLHNGWSRELAGLFKNETVKTITNEVFVSLIDKHT